MLNANRPTKYIDEAEKLYKFVSGKWESSPIIELINGSYAKGSTIPRAERVGTSFQIVYYACYSPTMVGSISGLRDATATRAITHILTRSADKDARGQIEIEAIENEPIYQTIRDQLYLLLLQDWAVIEQIYNTIQCEKIKKRDWELWKPLLTIAKHIDTTLYDRVLKFAEIISDQKKSDFISEGSMDYKILFHLKQFIDKKISVIRVKEITYLINQKSNDPISEKTVSTHLDKLGFKDFRKRDKVSSYFEIDKSLYCSIVETICPSLADYSPQSPHSTYSTYSNINNINNDGESVVNDGKYNDNKNEKVVNVANDGANGENIEKGYICNTCNSNKGIIFSIDHWLCESCYDKERFSK